MSQRRNQSSMSSTTRRTTYPLVRRAPLPSRRPVVPVSPPKKKKTTRDSFDLGTITTDILDSITNSFKRPVVLLSALVVAALVVTHYDVFSDGYIGQWVKSNPTNSFAQWIGKNEMRFIGLLIFVPTLMDLPKNVQMLASVGTLFWCMIVPETSVLQYVLQSLALHTYFRVKLQSSRIAIIAFVATAYYVGWFTVDTKTASISTSAPSASPSKTNP